MACTKSINLTFSAVDTIGNFVKVVARYDNEWGCSCCIADLLKFLEDKGL